MTTQQITCDECGEVKKETNNWFKLWVCFATKQFSNYDSVFGDARKMIHILDLCGQDCLHNTISKIIGQTHE